MGMILPLHCPRAGCNLCLHPVGWVDIGRCCVGTPLLCWLHDGACPGGGGCDTCCAVLLLQSTSLAAASCSSRAASRWRPHRCGGQAGATQAPRGRRLPAKVAAAKQPSGWPSGCCYPSLDAVHVHDFTHVSQIVTGVVLGVEFAKHDNTLPNNVAIGVLVRRLPAHCLRQGSGPRIIAAAGSTWGWLRTGRGHAASFCGHVRRSSGGGVPARSLPTSEVSTPSSSIRPPNCIPCPQIVICVFVAGFAWSWGPLGWLVSGGSCSGANKRAGWRAAGRAAAQHSAPSLVAAGAAQGCPAHETPLGWLQTADGHKQQCCLVLSGAV